MREAVVLTSVLDMKAAGPLKATLMGLRGQPAVLDASNVERLGGLCLQVLLSAFKTWQADGLPLNLITPSQAFCEQWAAFGAADIKDITPGALA
ncbi:hypothetical protein LTR94_034620, partial [Friedmanniomyces endolithicus]